MEAGGRSRTPSRMGSGSFLGEQLFARKIEQKLQKQNALLEARLQLQRLQSGASSQSQSALHSHGTNTPGTFPGSEPSSHRGGRNDGPKPGRGSSLQRNSAGYDEKRGGATVSSQRSAPGSSPGQGTGAASARGERRGDRDRISEYTGQVKSGGSVAGMYDPKYARRSFVEAVNAQTRGVRKSEQVGNGLENDRGEEHPSWLFADKEPSRRSSDQSRASESRAGVARRESLENGRKSDARSQARVSERGVSGTRYGNPEKPSTSSARAQTDGAFDTRKGSDVRRGKPIQTLRAPEILDDSTDAASTSSASGSFRVPTAVEEVEILRERIASGSAGPSGRPFSGSLPDEVAQREQDMYDRLYQPVGNSLLPRQQLIGGGTGLSHDRSNEASRNLTRSSSKLEELLTRVEKEGFHSPEPPRVSTSAARVLEGVKGFESLEGIDSPQGGFRGERRSQPHEEAPGLRVLGAGLDGDATRGLFCILGGGGLTSLLNGGFLSEGLGVLDAGAGGSQILLGRGSAQSLASVARIDDNSERRGPVESREASTSKAGRHETRESPPTSRPPALSRSGSARLAESSARSSNGYQTQSQDPRRPSSASDARERHVSLPERPASASNAHHPTSRSDPTRGSHVAPSARERAPSNGRHRLERTASGNKLGRSLSRSGSSGHVGSSGGQQSALGRNAPPPERVLNRSDSKTGVFRIVSPLNRGSVAEENTSSAEQQPATRMGSETRSSRVASGGQAASRSGLLTRLDSGASEDLETPTLAQERAKMAGVIPRPERPPAFVRSVGLERARSVSPGGRRRIEDRFEEESKERARRRHVREQERQEEREKEELAECTFAPVISAKSHELFDSSSRVDFLSRICAWKARRDARLGEEKERRARRELKECTFQPAVTRYESPRRERPAPARGGFWRAEWDGLPARAPNWEGSLRDGASYYALEQQKQGSLSTTLARSTSAPPLRPWSAVARPEPKALAVRFDYGLSRLGFEPDRPASALRGSGFGPGPSLSRQNSGAGTGQHNVSNQSTVTMRNDGEIDGLEGDEADVADGYSTASQRALTEWEARHYERMTSARRHSMDLRRLLNQINGSSWRYHLTRPREPNLSNRASVKVKALEMPISPYSSHPFL